MIDLGLNQYKIKEIKYEVKEGKTVIFKLNNFYLEDVDIIDESNCSEPKESENIVSENGEVNAKKLGKEILEYIKERTPSKNEHPFSRKPKELHDYDPVSCLEHGLRQTLEASRKKEWIDDVKENPSKPTPTGNALFPIDNTEIGKAMSENTAESLGTEKFYTISKEAAEAIGFKKVGTMKIDKTTDKIIEFIPNSNKDEDKQEE